MRIMLRYVIAVVFSMFSLILNAQTGYCDPGDFTLNNPSSSSVGSSSISLSWTSSVGADHYTVQYRVSGSSGSYSNGCGTSGTSCTTSGLSAGVTYEFKVVAEASCTDGEGFPFTYYTSSNTRSERMEPSTPTTNSATSVGTSSFTARWNSRTGATDYYLDVSTSSSFSSFVSGYNNLDVNSSTSRSVTGLSPGTRYYYRVRAGNYNGTSSSSSSRTVYTVPSAPNPSVNSETQTSIRVTWNDVAGAENYRLDVSTNSSFSSFVSGYNNLNVGSNSSYTVTGLTPGTRYYFRMRSYDSNGNHTSANSSTRNTETIPSAPIANEAVGITNTSFTADWDPVNGADNYLLDISANDLFTSYISGYNAKEIGPDSELVIEQTPGEILYYRVRAENTGGESPNSSIIEVVLPIDTPVLEDATSISSSGFALDWNNVDGADMYEVHLSDEVDFSSAPAGYPQYVSSSELMVIGVQPGTTYYARVRARSSDFVLSQYSNELEVLTLPLTPEANDVTSPTQTTFIASWNEVDGANNYVLDVSVDDFITFLEGYNAKDVSGTSEIVSGLNAGTSYSYRVRAENATDETPNSNVVDVLTFPADPVLNEPANITQTSFTASWDAVEGIVDDYLLDVSESVTFSSFVTGYQGKGVELTFDEISGLESGKTYFYRVRSKNNSGQSNNSDIQSALTIPATPSIAGFSEKSATRIKVSWEKVVGADSYEILVSENSEFTTLVPGNDPKVVSASLGEEFIKDLDPATVYYVKVRSRNSTDASSYSEIGTTSTTDSDGNLLDPKIEIANADVASINFNVTGGLQGITSVKLFHKKRTEAEFGEIDMEVKSDGVYFLNVQPEWLDDFGMDYRIAVEDGVGAKTEFSNKVLRQIDRVEINSVLSFGSAIENYSIISVPYDMGHTIEDIFERLLGEHDASKWRIVQYRDGDNFDYIQGLSKEPMNRGEAYWFISTKEIELNLGSAIAPENTHDNLFQMSLKEGWNQIGNPYPFDISWSDVLSHNSDVLGVGPLFVFDPATKSFKESDDLVVFGGGFVFSGDAVSLEIPIVLGEDSDNGRVTDFRSSEGWEVEFNLRSGEISNQLSSIGMRPDASEEMDEFDQLVLPRFVKYVEFKSLKENQLGYQLSRDLVDVRANYQWEYQVESNVEDQVTISWDASQVPAGTGIFIHDKTNNLVINMKDVDGYDFDSGTLLKIYAIEGYDELEGIHLLGTPYPNPIENQLTIPFDFGIESEIARLVIYNPDGSIVFDSEFSSSERGLKRLEWNTTLKNGDKLEEGMYVYSIYSGDKKLNSGRIIKK